MIRIFSLSEKELTKFSTNLEVIDSVFLEKVEEMFPRNYMSEYLKYSKYSKLFALEYPEVTMSHCW